MRVVIIFVYQVSYFNLDVILQLIFTSSLYVFSALISEAT